MLRFLHLSDIHFSDPDDVDRALDVEHGVRQRMLRDIGGLCERLGAFDAVVVVGDIGSSGRAEDYVAATEFLAAVTELIGCSSRSVICVPGNHDVDRTAEGPAHEAIRLHLRTQDPRQVSDSLYRYLQDDLSSAVLMKPFEAYNEFALGFACDVSAKAPVWAPKAMSLGPRMLYVHGVTSAWISDSDDSVAQDATKLVVGLFQLASVGTNPDAVYMTLCHHPPRWLRDHEVTAPWFATAHLVLTGHEHDAGIYRSPDGRTVHIASGAVNPVRGEDGWVPAYNVIELECMESNPDLLQVSVYARSWQDRAEFGPDPQHPDPLVLQVSLAPTSKAAVPDMPLGAVPEPQPFDSSRAVHGHTVMAAPRDRRRRVARELGLLDDEIPEGLAGDREILRRAAQAGRLADLASRLVGESADG